MSGFQDAIALLYAEAERLRDAGQKKKAAAFAEAACFLGLRSVPTRTIGPDDLPATVAAGERVILVPVLPSPVVTPLGNVQDLLAHTCAGHREDDDDGND